LKHIDYDIKSSLDPVRYGASRYDLELQNNSVSELSESIRSEGISNMALNS
jgi:hypothetical protein